MGTHNSINAPALINKGDLLFGQGGGANPAVLPASTDGRILTLDSTQPTGTKWAAPVPSGFSPGAIVVSPNAGQGDYTTLGAALAVASAGQTIFMKEGVYVENNTFIAGVNIVALGGEGSQGNVIIKGKNSFSGAGRVAIYGIRLVTNGDYFLEVTGSAASEVNLIECYLDCVDFTGIHFTSSNAAALIKILEPEGDLGTTGIAFWDSSATGYLTINNAELYNTGLSTTASTASDGHIRLFAVNMASPIALTANAGMGMFFCNLEGGTALNTTMLAHSATAGVNSVSVHFSRFTSGTATAITIGAGSYMNIYNCHVATSNTDAISGLGNIYQAGISFFQSSNVNVASITYAPMNTLNIYDKYTLPSVDGLNGQVLTTNGSGVVTWQPGGSGSGITTLAGDTGSATGSIVNVIATAGCGSSVSFDSSSNTLALNASDSNDNTFWGLSSGSVTAINGPGNSGFGKQALQSLSGSVSTGNNNSAFGYASLALCITGTGNSGFGFTTLVNCTGSSNTAVGTAAGGTISSGNLNTIVGNNAFNSGTLTGSYNIGIGQNAGQNYTSSEASNILIGNQGTAAESNTLRIGTQGSGNGQVNRAFVAGIVGVATSNSQMVTIDSITGQLGAATIPSGGGFTWNTVSGTSQSAAVNNGYIANNASLVTVTLPSTASVGDIVEVAGKGAGGWSIAQNSSQVIHMDGVDSTTGTGGSLSSTVRYDAVRLLCITANTDWLVLSGIGNLAVV